MYDVERKRNGQNVFFIYVDEGASHRLRGRYWHSGLSRPAEFSDMDGLMLSLDRAMNDLKCPESSTAERRFGKRKQPREARGEETALREETSPSRKGEKATFVVQVQYRQHASWQGNVVWAERGERKPFRSVLELIKLIDSALEESGIPEG